MKLNRINILGMEYSIEYCDNPANVDMNKRSSLWGQVDYWEHKIRIYDNNTSDEQVIQTLLHEILHVIVIDLKIKSLGGGYNNNQSTQQHEDLDMLAIALTDTFCRNNLLKQ